MKSRVLFIDQFEYVHVHLQDELYIVSIDKKATKQGNEKIKLTAGSVNPKKKSEEIPVTGSMSLSYFMSFNFTLNIYFLEGGVSQLLIARCHHK